ncbi:AAA family ATPase [uncultured Fibrobacter sp.]|uniref:AAA family ATPase n=1 Tax=uncultured Fibrobacter sp. TaxID=261512 RepID=UPI0025F521D4|nr:AAA family ATPase [uncultured Fibrobacter sp.]
MKEILKEKSAATFYRMVMAQIQKYDENFSKLSLYFQKTGTGDRLKIDKPHFACCVDALPNRKSDYDESVTWTHEGKTYCLYLEFTPKDLETAFIPKFNVAYANVFSIEKNAGEYILLSLQQDVGEAMDENDQPDKIQLKANFEQKIFFGAPGTGKSFKIDDPEKGYGLKDVDESRKFRTTFHPDYDYAQFVGAYKPKKELNNTTNKEELTYSFVPQVFAKAYAAAWRSYLKGNKEDVFLVIEEINRGNCAQIFGDIFQLLDRNGKGFSDYSIDIDSDFADWLRTDSKDGLQKVWKEYINFRYKKDDEEICPASETKIALPPNLNILATMNTSDQSLFPMDSAFKRRFDWEYVPIRYAKDSDCGDDWKADEFKIVIGDSMYMWLDFLKKVNADIYDATQSEDKQMGEFFIKPKSDDLKIAFNEFRSKVLFYLWDSVYKDETERQAVFHFPYGDGDGKINSVTFQSLFGKDAEAIVNKIMENLKVEKVTA